MVRDELITSLGELRESREELRAANDDLNDKITQLEAACREASESRALLEVARREASEVVNSAEQLNEERRGLRGDLHQQVTLVARKDEVIGKLRDQASAQWASGWLAFQQKVVRVYPDLDFNFDLPSDEEAEESFSVNYSQESGTPAEGHSPSSSSVPPADTLVPVLVSARLMSTFIPFLHVHLFPFVGPETQDICSPPFNKYSFFFIVCILIGAFSLFFMNRMA